MGEYFSNHISIQVSFPLQRRTHSLPSGRDGNSPVSSSTLPLSLKSKEAEVAIVLQSPVHPLLCTHHSTPYSSVLSLRIPGWSVSHKARSLFPPLVKKQCSGVCDSFSESRETTSINAIWGKRQSLVASLMCHLIQCQFSWYLSAHPHPRASCMPPHPP